MATTLNMLDHLRQVGRWRDEAAWTRVRSQLQCAEWLAQMEGAKPAWKKLVEKAMAAVAEADPTAPADITAKVEGILAPMSGAAKERVVYCAGHAHIDMNWQWGWPETVGVTLDTFRTMLTLLEEFPEFHFSQSQASVYAIVEKYEPTMLKQIAKYVKQGRWEVTASHWVENDPNIAGAEPLVQHLIQTRTYMRELFGLQPEDVAINFAPDSFGHAATTPSYLAQGGVRHVYLHRPGNFLQPVPEVFWWQGPDGARVLVHNAQRNGYNGILAPRYILDVATRSAGFGQDCSLYFYGVGDHGGGPTRRDLLYTREMNAWPIFPIIKLAASREYYERIEKKTNIPVIDAELNAEVSGCYTSQTLIKRDNRLAEARMQDADTLAAFARLLGIPAAAPAAKYGEHWRNVLFSHFHDILPGSCVRDTRYYCHGQFQETAAFASVATSHVLRTLAERIDTTAFCAHAPDLPQPPVPYLLEGLGSGSGIAQVDGAYSLAHGHGVSPIRPFAVFNPTAAERTELVRFTLWDREFAETHACFRDLLFEAIAPDGTPLSCQRIATGGAWGHANQTYGVELTVPPLGYTTLAFRQRLGDAPTDLASAVTLLDATCHCSYLRDGRAHYGIENDYLSLRLDPATGRVVSLFDKTTGTELLDPAIGIALEYSVERSESMNSWILDPAGPAAIPKLVGIRRNQSGPLTGSLDLTFKAERSTFHLAYRLDTCSRQLRLDFSADWLEVGTRETGSPNLRLAIGTSLANPALATEIPFGALQRPPLPDDKEVAALRWACLHAPAQPALLLLNDCKHGHALTSNTLRVNLIRASFDPDPFPELGQHKAAFAIEALPASTAKAKPGAAPNTTGISQAHLTLAQYADSAAQLAASGLDLAVLIDKGQAFNHPLLPFGTAVHSGDLPPCAALVTVSGNGVSLSCCKPPADGSRGLVLRLVNILDKPAAFTVAFDKLLGKPKSLTAVDLLERPANGDTKKIPAKGILTIKVEF